MWEKKIEVEAPYDFNRVIQRLSLDPLHHISKEEQAVRIPIYAIKYPTIAIVKAIGTIDQPKFVISSNNHEQKKLILEEVQRIFQWDVGLKQIQKHFVKSNLKSLFIEHEGTPLICDFSIYSCLIKCIIHQQLNLKFAHTLTERFVHKYGHEQDGVWFYPSSERAAEISYEELRELQFSGRKAEYVIDTSRLIADGVLNLNVLFHQSNEEVIKELVKIRGIGPWTAQNVVMFGMGRRDLLPKADIGIQNAIKRYFNLERKPTNDQLEEFSKGWFPYRSFASLYLWRSIEPS